MSQNISTEYQFTFTNNFKATVTLSGNINPDNNIVENSASINFNCLADSNNSIIISCDSFPELNFLLSANAAAIGTGCVWILDPHSTTSVTIFSAIVSNSIYKLTIDFTGGGGGIAMVGTISTKK